MAQNEPQRKKTPPGPSPNSPSLLFEYQCRSGKFIRLPNLIESKKIDSVARIESNRIETFFARIGMLYSILVHVHRWVLGVINCQRSSTERRPPQVLPKEKKIYLERGHTARPSPHPTPICPSILLDLHGDA